MTGPSVTRHSVFARARYQHNKHVPKRASIFGGALRVPVKNAAAPTAASKAKTATMPVVTPVRLPKRQQKQLPMEQEQEQEPQVHVQPKKPTQTQATAAAPKQHTSPKQDVVTVAVAAAAPPSSPTTSVDDAAPRFRNMGRVGRSPALTASENATPFSPTERRVARTRGAGRTPRRKARDSAKPGAGPDVGAAPSGADAAAADAEMERIMRCPNPMAAVLEGDEDFDKCEPMHKARLTDRVALSAPKAVHVVARRWTADMGVCV